MKNAGGDLGGDSSATSYQTPRPRAPKNEVAESQETTCPTGDRGANRPPHPLRASSRKWANPALSSNPRAPEAERVPDDRDRAEAHRRRGDHRVQQDSEPGIEDACGQRDARGVVDESEEQVLLDVPQRLAADPAGPGDGAQIAFHQGDTGALHRDVGSPSPSRCPPGPGRAPGRR